MGWQVIFRFFTFSNDPFLIPPKNCTEKFSSEIPRGRIRYGWMSSHEPDGDLRTEWRSDSSGRSVRFLFVLSCLFAHMHIWILLYILLLRLYKSLENHLVLCHCKLWLPTQVVIRMYESSHPFVACVPTVDYKLKNIFSQDDYSWSM